MKFSHLFPTAIASTVLYSLDVANALSHVTALDYTADEGDRGFFSVDQQVLSRPEFSQVRAEVEELCVQFAQAHGHVVEGVQICSSWANSLPDGHRINQHNHANSYISGCIYLTEGSPIEFFNAGLNDQVFNFAPEKRFDPTNGMTFGSVYFDVAPGQVLLFPSGLVHAVRRNSGPTRYSIAFNALPTGLFGEPTKQIRLARL